MRAPNVARVPAPTVAEKLAVAAFLAGITLGIGLGIGLTMLILKIMGD